MCAKLKRRKNASVNEKAQITRSIMRIVQRGILYFQKTESSLYIGNKDKDFGLTGGLKKGHFI